MESQTSEKTEVLPQTKQKMSINKPNLLSKNSLGIFQTSHLFKGMNEQKQKLTPKSTTNSSELRNIYPVRFITPRVDPIQNIKIKPKMKVSDLPDYHFSHTPLSP